MTEKLEEKTESAEIIVKLVGTAVIAGVMFFGAAFYRPPEIQTPRNQPVQENKQQYSMLRDLWETIGLIGKYGFGH